MSLGGRGEGRREGERKKRRKEEQRARYTAQWLSACLASTRFWVESLALRKEGEERGKKTKLFELAHSFNSNSWKTEAGEIL